MTAETVLSFINEKGGVGKSTLAAQVATAMHRQGRRVVLVDADPQGSLSDWRAAGPEDADLPPVIAIDRARNLAGALRKIDADVIVIDCPAKADDMAAAIVSASDLVLIVLQPSGMDVWASAAAVRLIRQKLDLGGKVDAVFLINRAIANTVLTKQIRAGEWNTYGLDMLDAVVGNRTAFAQAMQSGTSVFDLSDSAAKAEIYAVINELEKAKWL